MDIQFMFNSLTNLRPSIAENYSRSTFRNTIVRLGSTIENRFSNTKLERLLSVSLSHIYSIIIIY